MLTAESYRERAAACALKASMATLPRLREQYRRSAEMWLRKAEAAEELARLKLIAKLEEELRAY